MRVKVFNSELVIAGRRTKASFAGFFKNINMSARRHLKTTSFLVSMFTLVALVMYCAAKYPAQAALAAIAAVVGLMYWGIYRSTKDKREDDDKGSPRCGA